MGLVTLNFDLLTLKLVCRSHVCWAISLPILVFLALLVLELFTMYATDRRTDGRTKATLNAPYPTGGGIITLCMLANLLYSQANSASYPQRDGKHVHVVYTVSQKNWLFHLSVTLQILSYFDNSFTVADRSYLPTNTIEFATSPTAPLPWKMQPHTLLHRKCWINLQCML